MRLLLINPNTSADTTNRIVAAAKAVARPDTEIKGVTGEGSHAPTEPIPTIGLGAELRALMERSAP